MRRVQTDRYPSAQLMDRIEAALWTAEQLTDYIDQSRDGSPMKRLVGVSAVMGIAVAVASYRGLRSAKG